MLQHVLLVIIHLGAKFTRIKQGCFITLFATVITWIKPILFPKLFKRTLTKVTFVNIILGYTENLMI